MIINDFIYCNNTHKECSFMNRQELIDYCLSLHDVIDENQHVKQQLVIHHNANKKPFAYFYTKLNRCCISLKCEPLRADFLRQLYSDVVPCCKRNKQNWNTIFIDGKIAKSELLDMIDHSYTLTRPRLWANNKTIADENKFWPKNFYYRVFNEDFNTLPNDAECAINYVLDQFSKREKKIVLAHFKDYKSYVKIGQEYAVTGNRVSQIIHKALRKSRHPVRSRYFLNMTEEIEKDKIRENTIKKEMLRKQKKSGKYKF